MFDIDKIDSSFPMEDFRKGQREAIVRICENFNSGKKYVILEAPTGSGKSAIGFTLSQLAKTTYYLTPQKILQDQYIKEFGQNGRYVDVHEPFIDLKGRNAYRCDFWDKALKDESLELTKEQRERYAKLSIEGHRCDAGECRRKGKGFLEYCKNENSTFCKYYARLDLINIARNSLMNFHSFFYNGQNISGDRSLIIVDEAHSIENAFMGIIELKISDHNMTKYFTIPQFETPKEYLNYFDEIGFRVTINELRRQADLLGDYKKADEMTSLVHKFDAFVKYPDNWITLYEEKAGSHIVTLKPVFIDNYVNDYVFNRADHILLMSATILSKSVICESLGISDNEVASLRLGSTFPVKNRPIYYTPIGSMSYNKKADTFPALIKKVNEICKKYATDRGIIHTHTFEIAEILYKNCDEDVRKRFIYQKNFKDRSLAIDAHHRTHGAILLAPAMHEGLDLYDDLGRFQIICKMPYPSKADPQIAMRMEISNKYYDWCAACKLIQSIGRIVRHENDYGDTYILDSGFEHFLDGDGGSLIPKWVLDAIII